MKYLKFTPLLIILALLIGCSKSNDPLPPTQPAGSVEVEGNIKNGAVVWHNYLPDVFKEAFAVDTISTRSTLIVTDPTRIDDVSLSINGIYVDADVINNTVEQISGYKVDIFVEDESFLTKEVWACQVCYPLLNHVGSTECEGLWIVQGNTLFETDPAPALPLCQAGVGNPELCVTQFLNDPDCSQPSYEITYQEAGDGLWKASIPEVTVEALSTLANSVGVNNSSWVSGTNKYARFIVYNDVSVEVFRKDYVFDLVP